MLFLLYFFRYLELNSWMWQVNGLNLLVDPVFGVLDFGVPALLKVRKRVSAMQCDATTKPQPMDPTIPYPKPDR